MLLHIVALQILTGAYELMSSSRTLDTAEMLGGMDFVVCEDTVDCFT